MRNDELVNWAHFTGYFQQIYFSPMATEVGSALNWGIASAGLISHDFVTAISTKPDQHKVVAVAARSVDRAKEFASKHGISSHYGSYKDLASDPAVQVGIYTTCDCRDGYYLRRSRRL